MWGPYANGGGGASGGLGSAAVTTFCTTSAPDSVLAPTSPVITIAASYRAFAALHASGDVSAWGSSTYGGTAPSAVTSATSKVTFIAANGYAFAALHENGRVTAWGHADRGGTLTYPMSSSSAAPTTVHIYANHKAFTALTDDGSAQSWGDNDSGGCHGNYGNCGPSSLQSSSSNPIVKIVPATYTFCALHQSHTITCWGHSSYGGYPASYSHTYTPPVNNPIIDMATTNRAYAALHQDGTIKTWGHNDDGGRQSDADAAIPVGSIVVGIAGAQQAFAVMYITSVNCAAGQTVGQQVNDLATALSPTLIDTACSPCAPGTAQPLAAQTSCTNCTIGYYAPNSGQANCFECLGGYYQPFPGQDFCNACPAGRFNPAPAQYDLSACLFCNVGEFQALPGSTNCSACPPNTYSGVGATFCRICPNGFDCTGGQLTPCPVGNFSLGDGACRPCDRGYRCPGASNQIICGPGSRDAPENNFGSCAKCEAGKYQGSEGSTACIVSAHGVKLWSFAPDSDWKGQRLRPVCGRTAPRAISAKKARRPLFHARPARTRTRRSR